MSVVSKDSNIACAFFRGDHREVARLTIDSPSGNYKIADLPYVIGALSFLGRVEEAEALYRLRLASLTQQSQIACRFFLGVGFCRQSAYDQSREYFAINLSEKRQTEDPISLFYIYQGVGFYRYFCGRVRDAHRAAQQSFDYALAGQFLYGRAFAADLKGHALIQTGQISLGLKTLQLAAELAKNLKAEWLKEATEVNLVAFRARFGRDPKNTLKELERKLNKLSQQDTYSQSTLLLELAQQQMLRGRLQGARDSLDRCCPIVYETQNRRHEALLNLRFAQLHFLRGEYSEALNLVANTHRQLDPTVDQLLELKVLRVERKVLQALGEEKLTEKITPKIRLLTSRVGEIVSLRKQQRRTKGYSQKTHTRGEDPLGDLMDKRRAEPKEAIESILNEGYLGLLTELLDVDANAQCMLFDVVPGSLTLFDKGEVCHVPDAASKTIRRICQQLQTGVSPKKLLIESIWNYSYHPLRHDPLIYSSIAKLRKLLGQYSNWVEALEEGYQLKPGVSVRFWEPLNPTESTEVAPVADEPVPMPTADLNARQRKILEYLENQKFIDTSTCKTLFKTSEITANRDLSGLVKQKLLVRIGKARATKYQRTNSM